VTEPYSADSIQVLPWFAGVRKRPGMYVGDTADDGVRHLAWEVIANVVNEHLEHAATELHVTLDNNWLTVRDDGRGIPIDLVGREQRPALEVVLTSLFGRGRGGPYFICRGAGLAVVNALSARLEVETTCAGVRWAQAYERGEPMTPLRNLGPTTHVGTMIRFRPDPQIFARELTADELRDDLQRIAWLRPFLRVTFQERRLVGTGGLPSWACDLAPGRVLARASFEYRVGPIALEVGLAWCDGAGTEIHAFVDHEPAPDGMHILGIWKGLASWAAQLGAPPNKIAAAREVLGRGLVAVLHVSIDDHRFMRARTSQEACCAIRAAFVRDGKHRFRWKRGPLQDFLRERIGIALP
jgi:DNA gyrase subunit B